MKLSRFADFELNPLTRAELARYRHAVFVGRLGWQLPGTGGQDQDQFDGGHAVHIVAHDDENCMVGYARLLPTTGPYLLASLFPELLGGQPLPCEPSTWELSRYAAMSTRADAAPGGPDSDVVIGKQVLLQAIQTAAQAGAQRLIFCTNVAIERLAMRWGVDIRRVAAPVRHGRQLLVAALIEFSPQTFAALQAAPGAAPLAS